MENEFHEVIDKTVKDTKDVANLLEYLLHTYWTDEKAVRTAVEIRRDMAVLLVGMLEELKEVFPTMGNS